MNFLLPSYLIVYSEDPPPLYSTLKSKFRADLQDVLKPVKKKKKMIEKVCDAKLMNNGMSKLYKRLFFGPEKTQEFFLYKLIVIASSL